MMTPMPSPVPVVTHGVGPELEAVVQGVRGGPIFGLRGMQMGKHAQRLGLDQGIAVVRHRRRRLSHVHVVIAKAAVGGAQSVAGLRRLVAVCDCLLQKTSRFLFLMRPQRGYALLGQRAARRGDVWRLSRKGTAGQANVLRVLTLPEIYS